MLIGVVYYKGFLFVGFKFFIRLIDSGFCLNSWIIYRFIEVGIDSIVNCVCEKDG